MSDKLPTIDDFFDKYLLFDRTTHDKNCGVTITRDLGNCDCNKSELKAHLEKLMAAERLDALEEVMKRYSDIERKGEVKPIPLLIVADYIAQLTHQAQAGGEEN